MAEDYGTPRRTVLLESAGQPVSVATPLEVADDPCLVLLGAGGLLARTGSAEPPDHGGAAPGAAPVTASSRRARHDAVVSVARATARGHVGLVTSAGRVRRLGVLDLPALPDTAHAPHLQGGAPVAELLSLEPGERVLCLTSLPGTDSARGGSGEVPGLALGTARGVVKRVQPDHPSNKDEWDVIRLDAGDHVVGAVPLSDRTAATAELVFVTSDAQLLRFPAASVRPQGRSGGGVAGVKLSPGAEAVCFGAVTAPETAVVVTVAGVGAALPGTEVGTVKVTAFTEYPPKGRATGGVRAHRFLKGEQRLLLAWVGAGPAMAAASSGTPVDLPAAEGRRDGSGVATAQPIAAVTGPVSGLVRG
jgi:DNA gyrase subunit A